MDDIVKILQDYWVFLIPLVLLDFGLKLAAVIHILRHDVYRFGNRVLWIIVSVCVNLIGPVLYFTLGKGEE